MMAVTLSSILFSFLLSPIVLILMRHARVVDLPNLRSSHRSPTPRGGGAAVLLGLLGGAAIGWGVETSAHISALVAIAVIGVVGLLDDIYDLPVASRLLALVIVSLVVSLILARSVGVGPLAQAGLALVGGMWLVAYTNAFNFMDGVNGISGLNATLAGGWYAMMALSEGHDALAVLALATAGGALGFLPWNFPQARLFLGDVGSYGLGMTIGYLALALVVRGAPWTLVLAPLLIYTADTGLTLVRRIQGGRPWHEAHREHVYQRLSDHWGHTRSSGVTLASAGLVIVVAFAGRGLNGFAVGSLMAAVASVYLALPVLADWRFGVRRT